MKCEECLWLIEPHFDGELGPRESAAVAAHLGACEACARAYQSLRDEQSLYLRYGCDSTESPSFWDEVLSRAAAERVSAPAAPASRLRRRLAAALSTLAAPRYSPTAAAAMLLAAVVLTAVVMVYVRPRDKAPGAAATSAYKDDADTAAPRSAGRDDDARADSTVATAGDAGGRVSGRVNAEGTLNARGRFKSGTEVLRAGAVRGGKRMAGPAAPGPDSERLVREAERKYLAAIAALSRDVGRRPGTDLETMAHFERTLAVVDRAIAETRAAARKHPRDPVVVQYMMAAYAKKVDLLREMAQD